MKPQYPNVPKVELVATPNFMDIMQGMIFPDESLAGRVQLLVERFRQIAQSGVA